MEVFDDLHYNFRGIDGYNKSFNFAWGPRETGKTVAAWYGKIYSQWKKDKRPWIYLTRNVVDISESAIASISGIINKFSDVNVDFRYTKSELKSGILDVSIGDKIFFRVVALSIPLRRIKLSVLHNLKGVFMDEYIIDPRTGEKYVKGEAFKIKEAYTTWVRECPNLKFYFVANKYTAFNPLFVEWGIDAAKLKLGEIYIGDTFAIEGVALKPELREKLLRQNPLYKFDDEYTTYALDGIAVNDKNIPLVSVQPPNYQLQYVFKINGKYLGVYRNQNYLDNIAYYCNFVKNISKYRNIYCLELDEMVERCTLIGTDLKFKLSRFKDAISARRAIFGDVNAYYMTIEVFNIL